MQDFNPSTTLVYGTNLRIEQFIQALGELALRDEVAASVEDLDVQLRSHALVAAEYENTLVPAIFTRPRPSGYIAAYISAEDNNEVVFETHGDVREPDLHVFFEIIRSTATKVMAVPTPRGEKVRRLMGTVFGASLVRTLARRAH